jgi:hypothetical protein
MRGQLYQSGAVFGLASAVFIGFDPGIEGEIEV